jgi:flagellar M-ring protein FliF
MAMVNKPKRIFCADESGVDYQLKDNGKSIYVPQEQVYDLRLRFAAEGVSDNQYQGYELFDQNTLGMTDFMQRINKKRALEGELARTINSIQQVESSRIHIVLPERSPFQQTSVEPSASVILELKSGRSLTQEQIEGIGALIAGSVEGLTPDKVVILDQKGKKISDNTAEDSDFAITNSQMKIRKDTETYLTTKGQSMLDMVLGPGNSILRVSTEHDFDRLVRESDMIDPESRIVISEEKRTTTNADRTQEPITTFNPFDQLAPNQTPQPPQTQTVTTQSRDDESSIQVKNYETNRTREQYEKTIGMVTRISASILLDHKEVVEVNEEGQAVTRNEPFTEEEIQEIKDVVIPALGIQETRGDQIQVTQFAFQEPYLEEPVDNTFFDEPISVMEIIRWTLISLVMITISILIYRVTKNFSPQYDPLLATNSEFNYENNELGSSGKAGQALLSGDEDFARSMEGGEQENQLPQSEGTPALQGDIYSAKMTDEARILTDSNEIAEALKDYVEVNASDAARLVRSMMNEWVKVS